MPVQKSQFRLEIVAQQAKNESQVISAQNDIAIGLLNLKQTINTDPRFKY